MMHNKSTGRLQSFGSWLTV